MTVTPVTSVTVLAVLLGIWFIVIGFFEIIAGIMLRRAVSTAHVRSGRKAYPAPRSSCPHWSRAAPATRPDLPSRRVRVHRTPSRSAAA